MENLGCYFSNSGIQYGGAGGYGGELVWKSPVSSAPSCTAVLKSGNTSGGGGGGGTISEHHHLCRTPSLTDLNMGSFSLSPIDFEPLSNLFGFNPCSSSYKDFPSVYKEKNPHDMADVLLSLKHAVVHPGQMSMGTGSLPSLSPSVYNSGSYTTQQSTPIGTGATLGSQLTSHGPTQVSPTSVSFSVHPQAQVMSPAHHGYSSVGQYGHQYAEPASVTTSAHGISNPVPTVNTTTAHHMPHHQNLVGGPTAQGNIFPSMSVNVSMNMTMGVPGMHGSLSNPYNIMEQMGSPHQQQMQWGSTGSLASSASGVLSGQHHGPATPFSQNQNLMGPLQMSYATSPVSHGGYAAPGSYSFTAEFRPSSAICGDPGIDKDFGLKNINMNMAPFKAMKAAPGYGFGPVHGMQTKKRLTSTRLPSLSTTALVNGVTANLLHNHDVHLNGGITNSLSDAVSKVNLCRICGKTYARPSTLKTHMRTHSGEKPYRCSTCNKSFSQAANLTAHIRTHSGEKPFRCPICDRRFSQSSSVTTHMRTHSGERPYRCRMCKKAFSDSSTLTKHLRIHSGEKPYQCKLCLLRFSQSGNLNRHMRVHTNPV